MRCRDAGDEIVWIRKFIRVACLSARRAKVWRLKQFCRKDDSRGLAAGEVAAKHLFDRRPRRERRTGKFDARGRPTGPGETADQIEHIAEGQHLVLLPSDLDPIGDAIGPFCDAARHREHEAVVIAAWRRSSCCATIIA